MLAVGFSIALAHAYRKRWPGFAARWVEALATGEFTLDSALCASGINLFSTTSRPRPRRCSR